MYYIYLLDFGMRSICATGNVQSDLGCPVSFSPVMGTCDYREVLRIYQEAGGDSLKAVVTHIDCRFHENLLIIVALVLRIEYLSSKLKLYSILKYFLLILTVSTLLHFLYKNIFFLSFEIFLKKLALSEIVLNEKKVFRYFKQVINLILIIY
jgi:hypothetical protein